MEINWLGLASAAATFFGVWIGHISVRKIEREVERIWIPTTLALLFGFGVLLASFLTPSLILSTICGILPVTLFWDALELAVRNPTASNMDTLPPTQIIHVMQRFWQLIPMQPQLIGSTATHVASPIQKKNSTRSRRVTDELVWSSRWHRHVLHHRAGIRLGYSW